MKLAYVMSAMLLVAVPAFAADAPVSVNPVVAKVNGETITRNDLLEETKNLPPQVQQLPLQSIYPQLLEQMITERVVRKAAYDAGLQNSTEVKTRLAQIEKKVVADEFLRQQVKKQVTDDKLKTAYDAYVKDFKGNEEVRASHILVKTEKEANDLIKQIKGGADFGKLAAEKSIDKAAAAQAGDLGYFSKQDMVEPFAKAAFAMKVGEVSSKPVKTDFGFHVIKLADKRTAAPEPFEKMKEELEGKQSQDVARDIVKNMLQKATVERFQFDGSPMPAAAAPAAAPAVK